MADRSRIRLQRLLVMALLAAMAYTLAAIAHFVMPPLIPAVPFLKYDPKDIVVAIGGFLLGPAPAALIALVCALLEMVTISETGWIGAVMNLLSTVCFVFPAAWVYQRKRRLSAAVWGLGGSVVLLCAVMGLWNYLLTPLYMGVPREVLVQLLPWILLFNLLKAVTNGALTLLLYKPLRTALGKARLLPPAEAEGEKRRPVGVWVVCGAVLLTVLLLVLALNRII